MLTVTNNNFGADNDSIFLMPYLGTDHIALYGQVPVDTSSAAYRETAKLKITVAEDLPISSSRKAYAYVVNSGSGAHNITLTEVYIQDKNTIIAEAVHAYDSLGEYALVFYCLLSPDNKPVVQAFGSRVDLDLGVITGGLTGASFKAVITAHWIEMVFIAQTVTFDENKVEVNVVGLPDGLRFNAFAVFTESNSSATGSRFYPVEFANGILTIRKDGNADEAANASYKFFKIVVPR